MTGTEGIECLPCDVISELRGAQREVNGVGFTARLVVCERAVIKNLNGVSVENLMEDCTGSVCTVAFGPGWVPGIEVPEYKGARG